MAGCVGGHEGIAITSVDCNWRLLAANLGVQQLLPAAAHLHKCKILFSEMVEELSAAFDRFPSCSDRSLRGMWGHRTERGMSGYKQYMEGNEQDRLEGKVPLQTRVLEATGFRNGQSSPPRRLYHVLLAFRHAIIAICQSRGTLIISRCMLAQ